MKRFLVAVLVALAGSGSALGQLVNGSFETGTPNDGASSHWTRLFPGDTGLAGWSIASGNVDWFSAQAAPPCSGGRSLELNGNTNGAVAQTFATRPGVAYRVSFCLAGNPNGASGPPAVKTVEVAATGNGFQTYQFDATGHSTADMGWETRSYSFTATGPATTLQFTSMTTRDDGGLNAFGPVIDNIVVEEETLLRSMTDQWWAAPAGSESGWGFAVFQQGRVLFVLMYVYGTDNKPTWFIGVADYRSGPATGHLVFAGDLYATTGPYFGGPFGAVPVVERKVGTITLDSDTPTTAILTYTVEGTTVVKPVTRQFWASENLAGDYYGGFVWDEACGALKNERDHFELFGSMQVTHAADGAVNASFNALRVAENGLEFPVPANHSITLAGPYTQVGHLGRVDARFSFVFGEDSGSVPWTLLDIERTINGISGRIEGADGDCEYVGHFAGVRRQARRQP